MLFNNNKQTTIISVLIFILYITIFSILSIKKYLAYNCDLDFGNILQAFYNTFHGRFMQMTWFGSDTNVCRWGGHTEIIFTLLLPIFALFKHPYTLLIIQTIFLGAGGIAIYAIVLKRTEDARLSIILSLSYYLFPYLAAINLSDFHSDPFMILPQLMAWYCFVSKKPVGFWFFILLGMLSKEYSFIFNLLLGVMIIASSRKTGIALILLALFQFLILTPVINMLCGATVLRLNIEGHALISPAAADSNGIYMALKKLSLVVFRKDTVFKTLPLLILLIPALIRFPSGLILILPIYGALLALNQHGLFINHRHTIIIAPIFIVLIEGICRIAPDRRFRHALLFLLFPIIVITFCYSGSLLGSNISERFLHPSFHNVFHYQQTSHDLLTDSLITQIPAQAPIAAENNIRAHLALREWAFMHPYPSDITKADYFIFDFFETLDFRNPLEKRSRFAFLMNSKQLNLRTYVDGIIILKREQISEVKPFIFAKIKDDKQIDSIQDLMINSSLIEQDSDGYILKTEISHGNRPIMGDALISLFINEGDTIKVLHLPSYTTTDLRTLPSGNYHESFFFQIPQGKTLEGRKHIIALYKKDSYLPFFARPSFLIRTLNQ